MIGALYFLGGLLVAFAVSQPGLDTIDRMRSHISWRRFAKAVRHCLAELEAQKWQPDVIVGLNSGVVPASIIALNLRVSDLLFYDCLPSYVDSERRVRPIEDKHIDLSGKNILVVDDQAYTGKSLERIYDHLVIVAHADPDRIRRYVLFTYRHIIFTYETDPAELELEVPAFGHVAGGVKQMPWVFSAAIKPFWERPKPGRR
jgi:hypoxanthine phosphoribosyltransferase